MNSLDDEFDLAPALRQLHQLGLNDGDVGYEYWHRVAKSLRSVPTLRARVAELEREIAALRDTSSRSRRR